MLDSLYLGSLFVCLLKDNSVLQWGPSHITVCMRREGNKKLNKVEMNHAWKGGRVSEKGRRKERKGWERKK